MDYIALCAALPLCLLMAIFWSYDIACQWKLNLRTRIADNAGTREKFSDLDGTEFRFGIPKCHCPAHKLDCQPQHSLNLLPGLGRTDGEGIERGWSELNGVGSSTKEMGPGSRHDTIDDHLSHHNWRKSVLLGMSLSYNVNMGLTVTTQARYSERD